ncbi:MAG: dTDP-glucose 4,6-dehydratase [Actinomycetota bacterium]|nr:dTDP-glucose 4,6-dehydratase [Actinomycetota bacterium]
MKLMVTGGAGFIGSEFVRQGVEKGHNIVVVDKLSYAGDLKRLAAVQDKIRHYNVDIADIDRLKEVFLKEKPEAVINFAAETHVDRSIINPHDFIQANIIGTFNLLELSKNYKIERFVHISTDEVYGALGENGNFTEDSCINPNSPYSASKASCDLLARSYFKTYKYPVIIVRPSNNYGPWQYPEKLIPVVIIKALLDEPIPVYGTGKNVREWLYVEDCNEAIFVALMKGQPGEVYNIGSGFEKQNIDVVKTILAILGKSEELIQFVEDRPGHDFRYSLNTDKIRQELGWSAKTDFDTGLQKTVNWYSTNKDWLFEKLDLLKNYWGSIYKL